MGYAIVKIGDHYDNPNRVEIVMGATDDETSLPTTVPAGSIAYREDMSAQYLFGVSGTWADVTAVDANAIDYSVTYDANDGTGGPTDSNGYNVGDVVTVLFTSAPTRDGHTLLGWAPSATATAATYASGETTTFVMKRTDVTLYAVWEAIDYSVTYDANGGTGVPTDSNDYHVDDVVTVLFTSAPTRSGYSLLGWATTNNAATAAYASGGTTTFEMRTADVTLYAVWEAVDYSVTYDANGGVGGPTDAADYNIGDTVTVLFTSAPTYEGYRLLGWATTAAATVAEYTSEGTTTFVMGASNVTLYAVWEVAV
jgi:hypothetical protein